MRTQTLLVVVLALVFGGVAAVGALAFGRGGAAPAMGTILVATADVPRGEMLTADSFVARRYPKDLVPAGVLTRPEDAVGRATLAPLAKDEPILDGKLAAKGAGRGLAALIKKGMRAMTVQTPNVATGVAGFIVPGNKVDVLVTYQASAPEEKPTGDATTLLEDVEILAVDQQVDAPAANRMDASQMRSVTLSVTPDQAARLSLAQSRGTIHLSLRNSSDEGRATAKKPGPGWAESLRLMLAESKRASSGRKPIVPAPVAPAAAKAAPAAPLVPIRVVRTFRGTREGSAALAQPPPSP